jgi:hypothetical protein
MTVPVLRPDGHIPPLDLAGMVIARTGDSVRERLTSKVSNQCARDLRDLSASLERARQMLTEPWFSRLLSPGC